MVIRTAALYGILGAAAFAALSYGCMAIDARAGPVEPRRWYIAAPQNDMIGDAYIQPIRDPDTGCQYILARTEHGVGIARREGIPNYGCH